jgi:hypothetical protein
MVGMKPCTPPDAMRKICKASGCVIRRASGRALCVLALGMVSQTVLADDLVLPALQQAEGAQNRISPRVRQVVQWVIASADNQSLPFAVVDKVSANVFVFNSRGALLGGAAVLLGLATGDDSVPGIGQRKLASIQPYERTTPAGRFVAALDRNLSGAEVLWVDYESAVSMHPVITSNAKEHRAQRLATPTPLDNRITYGCINVPAGFFANVIHPAFAGTSGIVYVLPETRPLNKVFTSYQGDASMVMAGAASQKP